MAEQKRIWTANAMITQKRQKAKTAHHTGRKAHRRIRHGRAIAAFFLLVVISAAAGYMLILNGPK